MELLPKTITRSASRIGTAAQNAPEVRASVVWIPARRRLTEGR